MRTELPIESNTDSPRNLGNKPNKITSGVKRLLEIDPRCRDDNGLLNLNFYIQYLQNELTELEFIKQNISGSIERASRMLQRNYPELRGEKWIDRQKNAMHFRNKFRNQEMPEELNNIY